MKITDISLQARNENRVNVFVDGKYRFSVEVAQVTELGLKIGRDYSEDEIERIEQEGQFSKLYQRALEYALSRPHSAKEIRDYLYRKTQTTRRSVKQRDGSYAVRERPGYTTEAAHRVLERLEQRGYVDDESFARWWIESRHMLKGASRRKLQSELQMKGVSRSIIEAALAESGRSDEDELAKVVAKKRHRYPDAQKFKQYLARQGFSFDDINQVLSDAE